MNRDNILKAVKQHQPAAVDLPIINTYHDFEDDLLEQFKSVAIAVGGKVYEVVSLEEVKKIVGNLFAPPARVISTLAELNDVAEVDGGVGKDPHSLEDVDLSIIKAHFAVAENSALWVTEDMLPHRVLPFINQHLAVIISKVDIVPTMHQAYERIGNWNYGFGVFIAGPSKTADIEQSLVLGAHGPRSLTTFILDIS